MLSKKTAQKIIEEVILDVTNVAVEGCIFMSFFKAWNTEHTEPDQGVKGDKGNRHIAFWRSLESTNNEVKVREVLQLSRVSVFRMT